MESQFNSSTNRCPIQAAAREVYTGTNAATTQSAAGGAGSMSVFPTSGTQTNAATPTTQSTASVVQPIGNTGNASQSGTFPPLGDGGATFPPLGDGSWQGDISLPVGEGGTTFPPLGDGSWQGDISLPVGEGGSNWPNNIIPPIGGLVPGMGNCFSHYSTGDLPKLQNFIQQELIFRQSMLNLAARSSRFAPVLRSLAASSMGNARRMAAAYFLISGSYYWPTQVTGNTGNNPLMREIRNQYNIAKNLEAVYRNASYSAGDQCVRSLFSLIADDKINQISRLYALLGN